VISGQCIELDLATFSMGDQVQGLGSIIAIIAISSDVLGSSGEIDRLLSVTVDFESS
jgi:hypothetical protein